MPIFLSRRLNGIRERMEDPGCDPRRLRNTYAQFRAINTLFSGWRRVYRRHLQPAFVGRSARVLDVGFGGGDVPVRLARWAARDGIELEITAIDTDRRALAWAREHNGCDAVTFREQSLAGLLDGDERFDVVISNHLLHHLSVAEVTAFCDQTRRLARRLVLHNDIVRSDSAFVGFAALTMPFFHRSVIVPDGLLSIRRSFTHRELQRVAPPGWTVERSFPYRQQLIYRPGGSLAARTS